MRQVAPERALSGDRVGANRWTVLSVLCIARVAMAFQFQSVAAISPLLVEQLAIDFALLGTLIGVWMLPGTAFALPGSLLGGRFGDKRMVLISLAVMAIGSLGVASAETYASALFWRVVSGAGAVLVNVLITKMVADWFADRELATAMAILVVTWPIGLGLALVVLGPLATTASWPLAMQLTAWLCAAALVLVALFYRPASHHTATPASPSWKLSRKEIVLTGLSSSVWAAYNVAYILVLSFAPVLLARKGYSAADAALVTSFATWPLVFTVPLGGWLADRTRSGYQILLGCLVANALALPLIFISPFPLAALLITGLITGPSAGIIMALAARGLRPASRHVGMGMYFTVYYVAMALLPALAGWLRDVSAMDDAPLLFGSLLLLVAVACLMVYRRVA